MNKKSLIEQYEQTIVGQQEMSAARLAIRCRELINQTFYESDKTIEEIAEIMNVTPDRVQEILDGDGNYRISTIAKIMNAMNKKVTIEIVSNS